MKVVATYTGSFNIVHKREFYTLEKAQTWARQVGVFDKTTYTTRQLQDNLDISMTIYTFGTRTVIKGMLGMAKTKKEIATILCDGAWYADVPSGAYADEILKHLNDQSFEASAYRAQFATDDEWVRHVDENAD